MEISPQLVQECRDKANAWLEYTPRNREVWHQLCHFLQAEDPTDLVEAFYKNLEFGTGGLRGILGAGTNRMNAYTVAIATQGLANYLKKAFPDVEQIRVAVGYDNRHNSLSFARITEEVFMANGIFAYSYDRMHPTPLVSYAVRELGCQSGVMITASHNPKEYNGYKVYWEDGAQVLAPHDRGIIEEVTRLSYPDVIRRPIDYDLREGINYKIDKEYLARVHALLFNPDLIERHSRFRIVYTPLHGVGKYLVPEILEKIGFSEVHCVEYQMDGDSDFRTVQSPNPENPEAFQYAVELARKKDAELILATDPDADRIGVACKNHEGEWTLLDGNQMCLLLLHYILVNRTAQGKMQGNEFVVKTIVSSELVRKVAEAYGVEVYDCYTGFKWIARQIRLLEGVKQYIGGGEESSGFLAQDFVRDKDAVSACALMAEIAVYAHEQGKTLYDLLLELYVEYGLSATTTINIVKPGKSGLEQIAAMMEGFRSSPPSTLAQSPVTVIKDFLQGKQTKGTEVTELEMPEASDVLQWFTADGTKVSVRPSGTEPKIKVYIEISGSISSVASYLQARDEAIDKIAMIATELGLAEDLAADTQYQAVLRGL